MRIFLDMFFGKWYVGQLIICSCRRSIHCFIVRIWGPIWCKVIAIFKSPKPMHYGVRAEKTARISYSTSSYLTSELGLFVLKLGLGNISKIYRYRNIRMCNMHIDGASIYRRRIMVKYFNVSGWEREIPCLKTKHFSHNYLYVHGQHCFFLSNPIWSCIINN